MVMLNKGKRRVLMVAVVCELLCFFSPRCYEKKGGAKPPESIKKSSAVSEKIVYPGSEDIYDSDLCQ